MHYICKGAGAGPDDKAAGACVRARESELQYRFTKDKVMTIDFNSMEVEIIPHFKGGEKEMTAQMFFDGKNRILHGRLQPGASIGEHTHETNSEILFVVNGEGTIYDDGVPTPLVAGQCTYCPKGHKHMLVNTGDKELEFYAAVPEQ